jgi:hypothetical protein
MAPIEDTEMTMPTEAEGSEWFWSIIAASKGDRGKLREELMKLKKEELRRFQEEFLDLAGELMMPPFDSLVEVSEDGLADVAEWVVSHGKHLYHTVLSDPTSIPHSVEGKGSEILSGVAPLLFEERFGESLDIH